jgi:hypothetical protein
MQNMPGRKVDEGIIQSFLATTNPSCQRKLNSASLAEILRSFTRGSEILYTCSRNTDLAHDMRAIEHFGSGICPVGLATPGLQKEKLATVWIGILAGISSPF